MKIMRAEYLLISFLMYSQIKNWTHACAVLELVNITTRWTCNNRTIESYTRNLNISNIIKSFIHNLFSLCVHLLIYLTLLLISSWKKTQQRLNRSLWLIRFPRFKLLKVSTRWVLISNAFGSLIISCVVTTSHSQTLGFFPVLLFFWI